MSSNELLLKIKGDSTGATKAAADTRAAIASLRSGMGSEFAAIRTSTTTAATGLQQFTNGMQVLGGGASVLTGPLGGISSRFQAVGTLAAEAGGGIGVMGVAIGALTVAAVGAVVVAVKLGSALFDLAKSTADYAGKLNDVSKQTNFTVETLSALTLAAKTSGGSLDTIAGSLGIFQANMVKAAEGNKDLAKTFRELKIDTTDQEKALRQAMAALFAMGETEKQSAAAKQLFGRAGKEVLGVIKETNGDLDKAIEKYQQMNLLVSTEAAAAADAFSDSLDLLNEQLAGVGRSIGNTVIPILTVFFDDMSDGLSGNQGEWELWAKSLQALVAGVLGMLQALSDFVKTPGAFSVTGVASIPGQVLANQASILERAGAAQIGFSVAAITERAAGAGARVGGGGSGSAGGKGKTAKDTLLQDATKNAALAEREALLINKADVAENQRALEEQIRDIREFTDRAIQLADLRHDAAIVRINAEQEALDAALARKAIKQKEYDEKNREIAIRNTEAQQKNSDETFAIEQDRDKKIAAAEQSARERALRIAEEADQRSIARIRARGDRELIAESEIERQIAEVVDEGFKRRREALEEEGNSYQTALERKEAIADELIRLDGERAGAAEDASRRIQQALFDEQNAGAKGATRKRRTTDPDVTDGPKGAIDQLFKAIDDNLTGDTHTAAMAGLTAMTEAFAGLGQAVGQVVQSFVLYGTAGASVRQVTAQILAGVAQQAAVKAVFELAEGFAALALAFFGIPSAGLSANAHFAAAAIYGTIAGVAAIAGRVVAGDSFSKQAGSASGGNGSSGGGGGSRGGSSNSGSPATQDFNRRNLNIPEVRVSFAPGVEDFLEAKILKRVRQPGELRDAIGNK